MAFDVAIETAGDNLARDRSLHVGYLFRSLINEQHDQCDIGMIGGNGLTDVLQHDRLAASRRSDNQRSLAFS